MSKGDHTSIQMPWGTPTVHNDNCEKIGWVDPKGDIHRPGDTGGFTGNPDTIGHVDDDGGITWNK